MNEDKIKKELEQLPEEWLHSFATRFSAQFLSGLVFKVKEADPFLGAFNEEFRSWFLFFVMSSSCVFEYFPVKESEFYNDAKLYNTFRNKKFHRFRKSYETAATYYQEYNKKYSKIDKNYEGTLFDLSGDVFGFAEACLEPDFTVSTAYSFFFEDLKKTGITFANEINFLKKQIALGKTPIDYFYQPLYASQSQEWLQRGKELVQILRNYGSGFEIWADWFQGRMDGIPTDKEFLETVAYLPEEILIQEAKHIHAYLKGLDKAAGTLNRVRVIFLGYGEAGKTSLIRALNGLEVDEGKEKMTPGIDISTWEVPDTEITAHFWDFGGQVVAHATHQFFLRSRCLYVLLLDGRTEINANEQAEYWLEHVRAFGSKAPVMLVGNKADLCAVNLDMARLKEKHDNVLDFYPLSCTKWQNEYALEFQRFQKDLSKEVAELGVHTVRFGKAHLAVLDELTERSGTESFLPKTDWLDLCADKGLAEQGDLNQGWLLDLFDKLGVIVHFPKLAALDSYILNPRWLTYGVYTLLYSPEAKDKQGRLGRDEIVSILSAAKVEDNLGNVLRYPAEKAAIIIQAMEQFKLCFPCRHEPNMIIIPALLDSDQPEHGFDKRDSLAFEFDFTGFLPRHIMPNFIVGRHDEIKGELVWQNGVVLQKHENGPESLVQVDYHDRKLHLWVHGPQANDYFKILYDDIVRILKLMPDLRFDEYVIVPETSRIGDLPLNFRRSEQPIRANFRQLLAMEEKGRTEYDSEHGTFYLTKILQIMPKKEDRQHIIVHGDNNLINTGGSSTIAKDHATINQNAAPKKTEPVVKSEKPKWYVQWWFISCVIGLVAGLVAAWQLHSFDLALACFALGFGVALLFNPMRRFFRTALSVLGFVTGANTLSGLEANIDLSGLMDKPLAFMFKLGVGDKPWLNVALVALAGFLFWLDSKEDK